MEDSDRTVYCGNLSTKATEEVLYELFLQVAPLERVKIPSDKEGKQAGYAFITFRHTVSVPYAIQLLNGIALYQQKLILKPRNTSQYNPLQDNTPRLKSNLNEMVLGGHLQMNNMSNRLDVSPVSRRDRHYNHNYDRRNDKPYGQVYRNRNNRYDYDSRANYTSSHHRRH